MKLFLPLLFLLFTVRSFAQEAVPVKKLPESFPKLVLKLNPFTLVDVDPTIQGAVEYAISPSVSVQQELGFMRISNWITIDERYPRSIFRSRSEVRLYLSKHQPALRGAYLAVEALYKSMHQPREGAINMGSYFEVKNYRYVKQVAGGHIKFGGQTIIGGNERWLFESHIGIGIRSIWISTKGDGIPPGSIPDSPFDLLFIENGRGHYTMPSATFGIKIGYLIYSKGLL